jgi:hypothetical protein
MTMARESAKEPYVKPLLQRRRRLTDVTEGDSIVVTGAPQPKGGCFSNKR